MAEKFLITCPHCGKSFSYELRLSNPENAYGSMPAQCEHCHKCFTIQYEKGKITRVG